MSEDKNSPLHERRFIFGATTAVITNMGLVTGLFFSPNAKMNIIGSILVIALADNISDSLGIHIFQEAEKLKIKEVWLSTLTNFFCARDRFFADPAGGGGIDCPRNGSARAHQLFCGP